MKFEFRGPGAPKDIPAEIVGSELTRIARRDGGILPRVVVAEAEPQDAVLHSAFQWNNDLAAAEHRLAQARALVRSVVLLAQLERNETAPTVRAFVSIHNPEGETPQERLYKPVLEVLANPAEAEEVKRRLRHELLSLRRRYLDLIELNEGLRQAFNLAEAAIP